MRENCIVCEIKISRGTKWSKRPIRSKHSHTCSRRCAKIYLRIEHHVRNLTNNLLYYKRKMEVRK